MSLRFVPSANKAAGAVCSLLSSEPFAHVQSAARCLGVELTADGPAGARSPQEAKGEKEVGCVEGSNLFIYINDINMQYLGREVREKSDIFMRQVQSNIFSISCYYGNFNICNISLLL